MNRHVPDFGRETLGDGAGLRRLDQALVDQGFFESRAKAREAIEAGLVTIDGSTAAKPAERVPDGAALAAEPAYPWVSRGGVKLVAALDTFGIDPAGLVCLDAGASTGGFTDVLLARGAAHVFAVDVGRGQLHPRIKGDPRVCDWSETDIRTLSAERFATPPDLAVCDVSFISLTLVLPTLLRLVAPAGTCVALVKPQFEVGRGGTRKGVVRDAAAREAVCRAIADLVVGQGWTVLGLCPSPIAGGDGNVEFLLGARRP